MSSGYSGEVGLSIVALLLVVALVSVFTLWTLNPTGSSDQSIFGIYLAVDLVSFAMISHIFRIDKWKGNIRGSALLIGCLFLAALLLFAAFLL